MCIRDSYICEQTIHSVNLSISTYHVHISVQPIWLIHNLYKIEYIITIPKWSCFMKFRLIYSNRKDMNSVIFTLKTTKIQILKMYEIKLSQNV